MSFFHSLIVAFDFKCRPLKIPGISGVHKWLNLFTFEVTGRQFPSQIRILARYFPRFFLQTNRFKMARFLKKLTVKKGLSPGSLVHVGRRKVEKPSIRLIDYDRETLQEIDILDVQKSAEYKESDRVSWINIYGLHDAELIQTLCKSF